MDERYDNLKDDLLDLLQCFKADLMNMESKGEIIENKEPQVAEKLDKIRNQLSDFFDEGENGNVEEEANSSSLFS